ncbi:MAG: energy-coupling factor ABC transporter ATP-binding protein, partial [Oscillospiraceae bacterium]|nr:energy-coupling factor ABC transporter ATP-binding protein [Oscillospiraceae bacterium]
MIELKQVSFSYDSARQENGIRDVNLTIQDGEVILICGESGCGKTTLTRLVNGLIPHFWEGDLSGEVVIGGSRISDVPLYETAKIVGSVFQNPRSQFFNVDTTSELAFGSENQGLPEEIIRNRVKTAARRFGIEPLMGRSIFELSGGEKQKIVCASVAACEPDILVLDEPSANLDAKATAELRLALLDWRAQGKTILIAEHRLHYLWDIADRIVYMNRGRIESVFTQQEFISLGGDRLNDMGLRQLAFGGLRECAARLAQASENLTFSDFRFSYKNSGSVLDVDGLHIPAGASVAIIGHNGVGKTTFARCICGLEKRCNGKMLFGDKAIHRKERLKHCYMVMQDVDHQLFTESVLDEILISMDSADDRQADEILRGLDLSKMKEKHPMALSGGEKQRVAIASAVASKRDIILFDEPTSGLDLRHMREVAVNIKRLAAMGKTVFVITHDPELILSCCTH